jgi:hypothetical protein
MSALQVITKELQSESINLKDARDILLAVVKEYPCMSRYLDYPSAIMHSAPFEMAIIKILDGREHQLNVEEANSVKIFLNPVQEANSLSQEEINDGTWTERLLKKRKIEKERRKNSSN